MKKKLPSKPPRKEKYIKTPQAFAKLFEAYKLDVKDNPITKHDYVGSYATSVRREIERPLTIEGFNNYVRGKEIVSKLGDYFSNKDGRYEAYAAICTHVRESIRQDQIEGGMAGIYNASITQRLNNLTESTSVEVKTMVPLFPETVKPN